MSWQAMTAVSRHSKQDGHLLRLILHLAEFADAEGNIDPAPNQETLGEHFGCSGRTIRNRLNELENRHELKQTRMGSGPGRPSAYRITLPMPEKAEGKAEGNTGLTSALGELKAEIKAEILSLKAEVDLLKAEIFDLKAEKAETKGGKGGSERRKAYSPKNADDPYSDPYSDPIKEREDAPARGVVVTGEIHPDCPYPQNAEETAVAIHPATWAWLDAQMAWPGYSNAAYIAARLGESPDVAALRQARQLWSLSNNKPGNAVGILDWYDELRKDPGWTPGKRFSTNGKGPNKPAAPPPSAGLKAVAPGVF